MFKKDEKIKRDDSELSENEEMEGSFDGQDTVIAQGVRVEGDFNSKGNVIIEGAVVGSVKTKNDLQVGEHAKITASVSAKEAHISGTVQGNVKIKQKLELSSTSRVYGDIEAGTLIINAGAIFNGKCIMPDPDAPVKIRAVKKIKKEEEDEKED